MGARTAPKASKTSRSKTETGLTGDFGKPVMRGTWWLRKMRVLLLVLRTSSLQARPGILSARSDALCLWHHTLPSRYHRPARLRQSLRSEPVGTLATPSDELDWLVHNCPTR
uniref:Uncharacterized protein n=1 Tax=Cacopsylla melanoneura TaxID=428564 RepID=A0A8D8RUR4_9HEMI